MRLLLHHLLYYVQARRQKFAMEGAVLGGLGAEPPAIENFAFFGRNNFILGLF